MGSRVKDIASRFETKPDASAVFPDGRPGRTTGEGASSPRGGPSRTSNEPLGTPHRGVDQSTSVFPSTYSSRRQSTVLSDPRTSPSPRSTRQTSAAGPSSPVRPSPKTTTSPHPLFRPSPPKTKATDGPAPRQTKASPLRPTAVPQRAATKVAAPVSPEPSRLAAARKSSEPPEPLVRPSRTSPGAPSPKPPSYKSFASSSSLPSSARDPPASPTTRTPRAPVDEASHTTLANPFIDGLPPISRGEHPLLVPPSHPAPVRESQAVEVKPTLPASTPPPSFSPTPFSRTLDSSTKQSVRSDPPTFRSHDWVAPAWAQPPSSPASAHDTASKHRQHNPLPPAEVFSRSSLPLSIPHLDEYLASLPPPDFPPIREGGVAGKAGAGLFPPFDMLAKKGGLGDEAVAVPGEWIRRGTWNLVGKQQVKYAWARPKSLLDTVTNWALGSEGSNFMSSLYSLEGAYGAVQILALVLGSVATLGRSEKIMEGWRTLFLVKVPNILALNFPSVYGQSVAFLFVYQFLALLLLFFFRRVAHSVGGEQDVREGFATMKWVGWTRSHRAGVMIMSFGLIVLYLPMSTMAVHAILWTSDFWVIPNPYLLEDDPISAQGVNFCYTTNLTPDSANFAPLIVGTSVVTLLCVTFYFPIKLWFVIRANLPRVDRWTELGRKRSRTEMEHEFQRVISRDENPLSFLYRGYRRRWGSYRAFYLVVKLVALLVVAIFSKDNCLFHSISRAKMDLIRQSVLIFFLGVFLAIQLAVHPFIDYRSNASEVVSRSTYVVMVILGLLVSLDVKGKDFFDTWALYFVYAISHGGNVWFSVVSWGWVQVLIQRIQKRVDFSIDIFSPHLHFSVTSPHIKRRVWQETLSTLLLATPAYRMPPEQKVVYSEPQGQKWPPYLVNFRGSVAERHVEDLKILREVGTEEYNAGLARLEGPDAGRYARVTEQILLGATGPDSYFRPAAPPFPSGVTSFFGHAWLVPFPLSLVMRYDQAREPLVITDIDALELYLLQNTRPSIRRRRLLRTTLRALEGQTLHWPYTTTSLVGKRSLLPSFLRRSSPSRPSQTSYDSLVTHTVCTLRLTRQGSLPWKGHDLGSGFEITLDYSHGIIAPSGSIGLSDDFELTSRLAEFLKTNESVVGGRLPAVQTLLDDYRSGMAVEVGEKKRAMGYGWLRDVYERPMGVEELEECLRGGTELGKGGEGGKVSGLARECERELRVAEARRKAIFRSPATALWYLFWDDLYRRNRSAISQLSNPKHSLAFSPYSPTSIAYRPLPRTELIVFLIEHGLWKPGPPETTKQKGFFGNHILNLLYWSLNEAMYHNIPVHLTPTSNSILLSRLPRDPVTHPADHTHLSPFSPAHSIHSHPRDHTYSSAAGTDHDDSALRERPRFQWEDVYTHGGDQGMVGRVGSWVGVKMGVSRFVPRRGRGEGRGGTIGLDLWRRGGEYVAIDEEGSH